MVKTTIKKLKLFFHKINKKCKENQGWNVLYIRKNDFTQLKADSKLCNLTSWELIKALQNIVQCYFSVLLKLCHKKMGEFLAAGFFKINNLYWHCRRSEVFIVNFEHVSQLALVFPLLTLSRQIPEGEEY